MIELVNLNDDITLAILLCCDVFSILKMEETCRYLRKVSVYRHLWLTLATNLDYDHAPNLLPHESLQSLSTDRLREMVIRSTRSYLNWTRPEGPKPTRSISFTKPVPLITLLYKLLPGAKYLVVLDVNGRFYVYDTDSQAQVGFYSVVYPRCPNIQGMDCLLLDEGNTLVLAYAFKTVEYLETCVTILHFDIHSGTSEVARIFTFAQDDTFSSIYGVVIGRKFVIIREFGKIFVGDWTTGEARGIIFERDTIIHSSFIVHDHLCVVEKLPGGSIDISATPLSVIFRDRSVCNSAQSGASTPYTYVRSQDVFRESTRVTISDTRDMASGPRIESVSVCTSSWKTPSMCEHDAPATPTRILFLACIGYETYMVSELLFSPAPTNPLDTPSITSNADDASRNGYLLTCRRRSLVRMTMPHLTSATRAGRLFAIYDRPFTLDTENRTYNATAINMIDPLEETVSDGSTTSTPSELFMRRAALPSPMDPLLNDAFPFDLGSIEVDTYSGAICYFAGSTLFIHRTD